VPERLLLAYGAIALIVLGGLAVLWFGLLRERWTRRRRRNARRRARTAARTAAGSPAPEPS